jgi:hypothetical protein
MNVLARVFSFLFQAPCASVDAVPCNLPAWVIHHYLDGNRATRMGDYLGDYSWAAI